MRQKEVEVSGGSLYYEIRDGKVCITGFHGLGAELAIPDSLEECPVVSIEKKALLSRKNLRRIFLPETIEEIGDWGFAYCDNLVEVFVPRREIRFGRSVFMECRELKRISLKNGKDRQFQPELLAAAVRDFEAYYLLDIPAVGNSEWLSKWDAKLTTTLHTLDTEGYSKQVLCGEEDYGSTDMEAYISNKRKEKVRLALLRLLFPTGLSHRLEEELKSYLLAHTKGGESQETWQVVWKEHGADRTYYSLFAELGCLNLNNLEGILTDIGEDLPEMKAFFLRYRSEKLGGGNFFEDLEL